MVRTQIQLTEEQSKKLKQLAAAEGRSVAELIRMSIDAMLSARPILDEDEVIRRVLSAMGKYSGPADLAARHDDYLAEAYEA